MKTIISGAIAVLILVIGLLSLMIAGGIVIKDTGHNHEIEYRIALNLGLILLGFPAFLFWGQTFEKLFTKRKKKDQ